MKFDPFTKYFPLEFVKEDHNTIILRSPTVDNKYIVYYMFDLNKCVTAEVIDSTKENNTKMTFVFHHCEMTIKEIDENGKEYEATT